MKRFLFSIGFLLSVGATQPIPEAAKSTLTSAESAILGTWGGNVYFKADSISLLKGKWHLLNDNKEWVCLGTCLGEDTLGYYLKAETICPNGHAGFQLAEGSWHCLNHNCDHGTQETFFTEPFIR